MVDDEERRNASLEGLLGTQKGSITDIDICGNTGIIRITIDHSFY